MLLVTGLLLVVILVLLAGGDLARLAAHRFRAPYLLFGALALQVLIISVVPTAGEWQAAVHVASYGLAAAFLLVNRSVPGLWLVGLGTALNIVAITANAGVMPASRAALEAAGKWGSGGGFSNSAVVADARLAGLGDVFAWPEPLPLANVFSIGDVLILIGATLAVVALSGARVKVRRWAGSSATPR